MPGGEKFNDTSGKNNYDILNILRNKIDIKKVFIIIRGPTYIKGTDVSHNYAEVKMKNVSAIGDLYFSELQKFVDILNEYGKRIYIVSEVPELPDSPRNYTSRPLLTKHKEFPVVYKKDVLKRQKEYLEGLKRIKNATVIYTIDSFCRDETCFVYRDGLPTRLDDDHLSYFGSEILANEVLSSYLLAL